MSQKLRLLDLFSGIGGFSLGLERTGGFETVAFCEINPFCRRVLAKHWPEVPCYDDVRTLSAARLAADGIGPIDVICGGFPCQDISDAGNKIGISGERSGLWSEIARLAGELRPSYVVVENVSALLGRGFDQVLGDLAAIGYDAEWECIPASAVGAPHRRDRVWIVAYPASQRQPETRQNRQRPPQRSTGSSPVLAHAPSLEGHVEGETGAPRLRLPVGRRSGERGAYRWSPEPKVGRMADGLPATVDDALTALGNAVVPQIPEILGRAILAAECAE